jgi:hypothetical protein
MIMSFIKFALLATLGEVIGLRIKTGKYNVPGFGILPRAIVWGFLGLTIKLAFVIFTAGTVSFLTYMGMENAGEAIRGGCCLLHQCFYEHDLCTCNDDGAQNYRSSHSE